MRSRSLIAAAFLLLFSGAAHSAEIKLLASGAVKEAYLELLPAFEKTSGHTVKAAWSNTTDIRRRVAGGETADLVILGDNGTQALDGNNGNHLDRESHSRAKTELVAVDPQPETGGLPGRQHTPRLVLVERALLTEDVDPPCER